MTAVAAVSTFGFMRHRDVVVTLPPAGVVVVTGKNGSGKSTFLESVSWALWGTLLRGSAVDKGDVCVRLADGCCVRRAYAGRTRTVEISDVADAIPPQRYPTVTKAQRELDRIVGPRQVWEQTCVFSSHDLRMFAASTDAERKRLMEQVLGLGLFDVALQRCRADLRRVREDAQRAQQTVELLREKLSGAEERAKLVERWCEPEPERLDVEAARRERDVVKDRCREILERRAGLVEVERAAQALVRRCRQRREKLVEIDVCPTCLQKLGDDARQSVLDDVARSEAEAHETLCGCAEGLAEIEEQLVHANGELTQAEMSFVTARVAAEQWQSWQERAQRAAELRATAAEKLRNIRIELLDAEDVADTERGRWAELEAAEKALGLTGARSVLLRGSLRVLECAANSRLLSLLPDAELRFDVSDGGKFELLLSGGGRYAETYASLSGGEKRRVDVALLLALVELRSRQANAGSGGTLWLDEVFDTLDSDGVDAVSELLRDVARDRCVVVITHSRDLAEQLDAQQRLCFVDGKVSSLR